MKEFRGAALGFLCAALIAAVIFTIAYPVSPYRQDLGRILATLLVYGFAAGVAVLLLGVPTFLILRPLRPGTWWIAALLGAALGIVVALVLGGLREVHLFPVSAATGALSALAFWMIWSRSLRPDPGPPVP